MPSEDAVGGLFPPCSVALWSRWARRSQALISAFYRRAKAATTRLGGTEEPRGIYVGWDSPPQPTRASPASRQAGNHTNVDSSVSLIVKKSYMHL